ncbi:hypothetical protein E2C01_038507 [Portunus trituberculatus]|uniref:Uncharacterized protein n=1 Tax=Portunus trituberculatus TaxID=210409 RepID=A0A5B7FH02_PORTR|nr:hypothetical protein [Portunus trituberculatus]
MRSIVMRENFAPLPLLPARPRMEDGVVHREAPDPQLRGETGVGGQVRRARHQPFSLQPPRVLSLFSSRYSLENCPGLISSQSPTVAEMNKNSKYSSSKYRYSNHEKSRDSPSTNSLRSSSPDSRSQSPRYHKGVDVNSQ